MTRPRLLDLFCCAGGCARGYVNAGFDVTGVDIAPQPRYLLSGASAFVQADALEYVKEHGHEYDAIHASPPCQRYSRATAWRGDRSSHPDLFVTTRSLLERTDKPWVVENVQEARHLFRAPTMLCGSSFGLPFRRHRWFELSEPVNELIPPCQHRRTDYSFDHGGKQTEAVYRDAMGCSWMTVHEARQAIPPVYAEWIGRQLLRVLEGSPACTTPSS